MTMQNMYNDIVSGGLKAVERISPFCYRTPLVKDHAMTRLAHGGSVYMKCENFQLTGSFKIRGVLNTVLTMTDTGTAKPVITSSTGNHAAAVAWAAQKFGLDATVYLPEHTSETKLNYLQQYSINIKMHGHDCVESELFARKRAAAAHARYIPPYNDPVLIAGQATAGFEVMYQLHDQDLRPDVLYCPVGGGGLISGTALAVKSQYPDTVIIGCQPVNSPVMAESVKAGCIVNMKSHPTLSDGTAGGIEPDSITFPIIQEYVDGFVLLSEQEIEKAVAYCVFEKAMLVEGAGALCVAAYMKTAHQWPGKTAVLMLSGAKLGADALRRISERYQHQYKASYFQAH